MDLTLDASYSLGKNLSGVGVYSRELLHALAQAQSAQQFRWAYRPHRFWKALQEKTPSNVTRQLLTDVFGRRGGLFHGLNQRLPQRRYSLQIATFHDLFVLTGDYSTPGFRERFAEQARHAASEADCIFAVSQFTADQVHTLLGVERDRIQVVHHGLTPRRLPHVPREPVVFSVGAIQTRKNTARLIEAFRAMPPKWRLVLAGSAGYGAESILKNISDPRVIVTGYLADAELDQWYARASIFAFPSLDEGFGMPILEAMAAGIPVVTSRCSAMPEIAGEAAVLIDPYSVEELGTAMLRLAQQPGERERLIRLGHLRANCFTWERAAQKTWAAYQRVISLPQRQS